MKLLIFGGSGQLGQELIFRAKDLSFEVFYPSIQELDITEKKQVNFIIKKIVPDVILNLAAYTAVDQAETDCDQCLAINHLGAKNIAIASRSINARLIHISTDYVFSGDTEEPLTEDAPTNPKSIYGKSKLEGEIAVLNETDGKASVIRTSSLHGKYGNNFVHTMLKMFDEGKPVTVVNDQFMNPCWAGFLAEALLDIMRVNFSGILHCACFGVTSWYDFAVQIADFTFPYNQQPIINPISFKEYNRSVIRPKYSAFDLTKCTKVLGRTPISWQDGLKFHLNDIDRLHKNKKKGLK